MSNIISSGINRRQKDKGAPSLSPSYQQIVIVDSDVTRQDMREILISSKRTDEFVCLANEKKRLLTPFVSESNYKALSA